MPGELHALAGAGFELRGLQVDDAPSLARHADDEAVWRNRVQFASYRPPPL